VDDKLILYGFVAGFVLNAVLAAQMVYYWNAPPSAKAKGKQPEPLVPSAPSLAPVAPTAFPSTGAATGATTPGKGRGPTTRRRG
jgi:mannose-P-dolichol utilization defect protein 1